MLDCLISGGLVVDGTGRPAVRADVGIRDRRIVGVGRLDEPARRIVPAADLVVAPGFVDVHTHYDAQVTWDPALTPSSLHGVTTVIGGNCGFTIAPVSEHSADYMMRLLANVEGIPVAALESSLDFSWSTFGEWLATMDGALGLNAGFMVGHSAVRSLVMGERSHDVATADELDQMCHVVDDSIRAGALGFSSSWCEAHLDHRGDPVPSRSADTVELVALAAVLRAHPHSTLGFVPTTAPVFPDVVVDAMSSMSVAARSWLNWNLLMVGPGEGPAVNEARLAASDRAAAQGGDVVALTLPVPPRMRLVLATTNHYGVMSAWNRTFALRGSERLIALSNPEVRSELRREAEHNVNPRIAVQFPDLVVESTLSERQQHLKGRSVGDVARERSCSALDAFLDIALADELETCFVTVAGAADADEWSQRAEYWRDPRVLVGGSDAGAHVDRNANLAYFTDFVGPTVRDRALLGLEAAVNHLTDRPARRFGLRDRGRIAAGYHADVVVFDPDTVATSDVGFRNDLPRGASRLYAEAVGVEHVLVNGTEVVRHGSLTGATPGSVLRTSRD